MIVKRLLLSATLLGMGLFFPAISQSATPVMESESAPDTEDGLSQIASEPTVGNSVDVELRLEPQADGVTGGEITFNGNTNEVIVVLIEQEGRSLPFSKFIDLYQPSGEKVIGRQNYPDFMTFDSVGAYGRTFLLPETGDYRLVVSSGIPESDSNNSSIPDVEYVMQVRNATYYERLLMSAETLANEDNYEAALSRLMLAIEDSPEIPAAYMYRLGTHAEILYELPGFESRLNGLDFEGDDNVEQFERDLFALIYETFLMLPAENQAVIVGDLRQLNGLYEGAIASGELDPSEDEFDGVSFSGIADFLETGVPTDTLRTMFFGVSVQTQEEL
ncbi:MAG: hypothetical protein ACFB0D_05755 [Phormidesmis sp.]